MAESNDLSMIKRNIELHVKVLAMNDHNYRDSGARVLELLATAENPMSRQRLQGHITCSGFVVNQAFDKAVLVHHNKLQRWLQPGGHMDPGEYPGQAAAREVLEETGLGDIMIWPPGLIDIDIHEIPQNEVRQEPAHLHYDLRYLFVANTEDLSPEFSEVSNAVWLSMDKILSDKSMPESVKRMARQAQAKQ